MSLNQEQNKGKVLSEKQHQINIERFNQMMEPSLISILGIQFVKLQPGECIAEMEVTTNHIQPMGLLHGGATIALAESVAGAGSTFCCDTEELAFGIQVSANHLHTARKGEVLRAIGKLLNKNNHTHLWEINVISKKDEVLVATIHVLNQIVKKR